MVTGATWTVFLIARQGYMIDAVPPATGPARCPPWAARTGSGMIIGPLVGAGLIHVAGLGAVFVLGAVLSLASALLALVMPDLGADRGRAGAPPATSRASRAAAHRRPC